MRRIVVATLVICLGVVGTIAFLLHEDSPPKHKPSSVQVAVESGEVRVRQGADLETVRAGESVLATATGSMATTTLALNTDSLPAESEPLETATPEPTPTIPPGVLEVRVVDALGDFIHDATLEINGTVYDATDGLVSIEGLPDGSTALNAHANGYESAQKVMTLPSLEPVAIELEYLCSFELLVSDEKETTHPIPGAEVQLWEGPRVIRPIRDRITLTKDDRYKHNQLSLTLQRSKNEIRIVRSEGIDELPTDYGHGDGIPISGDRILGMTGSMWNLGTVTSFPDYERSLFGDPIHSRIRIWDTLTLLSQSSDLTPKWGNFLEFRRGSRNFYCSIPTIDGSVHGKLIGTAISDSEGKCYFSNLPAGVYIAKARTVDMESWVSVIFPTRKGMKVWLRPRSESVVFVFVKKKGYSDYKEKDIEGANVQLKGIDNDTVLIGQTTNNGSILFKSVPFGNYKVTVTPPPGLGTRPAVYETTFNHLEPSDSIDVEFEVGRYYTISGQVLNYDTKQPVAGFPIIAEKSGQFGHSQFGYKVRSQADGTFRLEMLPEGEYSIRGFVHHYTYNGYLSAEKDKQLYLNNEYLEKARLTVDRNIENLTYYVVPGVKTTISGQTVDRSDRPVPNTHISIYPEGGSWKSGFVDVLIRDSNGGDGTVRADDSGRFNLTIYVPESKTKHQAAINAQALETVTFDKNSAESVQLPEGRVVGSMSDSISTSYTLMKGEGKTEIAFKAGEDVQNIQVVLDIYNPGPTIKGTIRTEDGNQLPYPARFSAQIIEERENRPGWWGNRPGTVLDNGQYSIQNVKPGTVYLEFSYRIGEAWNNDGIVHPDHRVSYQTLKVETTMPEDQDTLVVDAVLKRGSYMLGKVVNEKFEPVEEAYVTADALPESYESSMTDRKGIFVLTGLNPDLRYTLEAAVKVGGATSAHIEGIQPPQEDILIQIKTAE